MYVLVGCDFLMLFTHMGSVTHSRRYMPTNVEYMVAIF